MSEEWATIPEFPTYLISSLGNVYNTRSERLMRTSINNHGHVKITLKVDGSYERYTRSVSHMVATAFVEAPTWLCDHVILLDGDLSNVAATNLAWRPRWFAWKYFHQFKEVQPRHYINLAVRNIDKNYYYNSIMEAGMLDGMLFTDIWHSTYTGKKLFPYGHVYEIIDRV